MTTVNRLCIALLALAALWSGVARAQQGSVAGQVTDQASGHPLAGARVIIQGTALVTSTNAEGRYTLRNVPAGEATVRATIIGYAAVSRTIRVAAGETATADLALKLTPFTLDAVVSTVSGDQTKKETPNAMPTVRADSLVRTRPITNMNDLLGARVPGVEVLPGNITGAGARVRIRGTSSLSLNNEPIYIIDGVRMESANNSSSIGIGGTNPSRVDDIDPNEIESYQVVMGPAASTLYGTAASNGVIVIKTKRGTPFRENGKMNGVCCACPPSPGTASSQPGRSAKCLTNSTVLTRGAARMSAPTCRRTSRPSSTSRCRPASSRARSGCRRPTTIRSACCPTGSADRASKETCFRRTTWHCSATASTRPTSSFRRR